MLPIVVTKALTAGVTTGIVNAAATGTINMTLVTTVLDTQRRLLVTATGDESGNVFTVIGLNQANMTVTEAIVGPNASTTQSNFDFKQVLSIAASTATIDVVSVGTNGVGSSLWNIVNWHVAPNNIAYACVAVGPTAVNYSIQYTYDDPNNLPAGVGYPQPFNLTALAAASTTLDSSTIVPITAWRLTINSGTGTVRATGIQAGIGGP